MEQDQQPMEVDYEHDMNESESIASSVSIEDDAMDDVSVDIDDEMTGILYPQQLTLTIHLVQEADDSWTRTVE